MQWGTSRRIFYIVMFVLLLISLILFIIAVSISSSAQGSVPPTPLAFNATAQYLNSPFQIIQGSIMLSADYSTLMLFTDDLYLIDFTRRKVLWQAHANQSGSLTATNPSTGAISYGTLQFFVTGKLLIVDGLGNIDGITILSNKIILLRILLFFYLQSINNYKFSILTIIWRIIIRIMFGMFRHLRLLPIQLYLF